MGDGMMAIIETLVLIVLVAITTWYAVSTHRMLEEMRKQRQAGSRQTEIMVMATLVNAYKALSHAGAAPEGVDPWQELRELVKELKDRWQTI